MDAIVIGCGGTGKKALAFVKEHILADHDDDLKKSPFKLISIDADKSDDGEKSTESGVQIDDGLIHIQADIDTYFGEIENLNDAAQKRHDKYKYWSWINSDEARRHPLVSDQAHALVGNGMMRERGRAVTFQNARKLQSDIADVFRQSDNTKTYDNARVTSEVGDDDKKSDEGGSRVTPIFIVASTAGGTGSAQLFDVAACVHAAAHQTIGKGKYGVYLVLALPKCFEKKVLESSKGLDDVVPRMWANGYAALREMNRLMRNRSFRVEYGDDLEIGVNKDSSILPISSCFLVDGRGEGGSKYYDQEPTKGLYPAIGDFVYSLISNTSFVSRNCNAVASAINSGSGLFSSFGMHTYLYPASEITESFHSRFAHDIVDGILLRDESDKHYHSDATAFLTGSTSLGCQIPTILDPSGLVNETNLKRFMNSTTLLSNISTGENVKLRGKPAFTEQDAIPVGISIAHSQVREDADLLKAEFMGNDGDSIKAAPPQTTKYPFYPTLSWFMKRNEQMFEQGLWTYIIDHMNDHKFGGLHDARMIVDETRDLISSFRKKCQEWWQREDMRLVKHAGEKLKKAQNEMSDRDFPLFKLDNASEQRKWLVAYDKHLDAEVWEHAWKAADLILREMVTVCDRAANALGNSETSHRVIRDQLKLDANQSPNVRRNNALIVGRTYLSSPDYENDLYDKVKTQSTNGEPDNKLARLSEAGKQSGHLWWDFNQDYLVSHGHGGPELPIVQWHRSRVRDSGDQGFVDKETYLQIAESVDFSISSMVGAPTVYERLTEVIGNGDPKEAAKKLTAEAKDIAGIALHLQKTPASAPVFHGKTEGGDPLFDRLDGVESHEGHSDKKLFAISMENNIEVEDLGDRAEFRNHYDRFVREFHDTTTSAHVHVFREEKTACYLDRRIAALAEEDHDFFTQLQGAEGERIELPQEVVAYLGEIPKLRMAVAAFAAGKISAATKGNATSVVFSQDTKDYELARVDQANDFAGATLAAIGSLMSGSHGARAIARWYSDLDGPALSKLVKKADLKHKKGELMPEKLREGKEDSIDALGLLNPVLGVVIDDLEVRVG